MQCLYEFLDKLDLHSNCGEFLNIYDWLYLGFVLEYSDYKLNIYTFEKYIFETNKYNCKQILLMIDKKTYNKLKKYEVHLRRGYRGGYVFGLYQSDFDELYEIYKQLGGHQRLKYSCSSCTLQLLKFLGKLYYEFDEKLKEKESK